MRPDIGRVLDVCAMQLLVDVAPNLQPSYRQASAMVTGVILTSIREELDRGAARRVEENRALRELFGAAVPVVAAEALRARLEEAAAAGESGFLLSELEAENAALRALLIDLHRHVETLETPAARELEAAVWRELRQSTERRKLSLAPF